MAQVCYSVLRRWGQQDQEFKASLIYRAELEVSWGKGKEETVVRRG